MKILTIDYCKDCKYIMEAPCVDSDASKSVCLHPKIGAKQIIWGKLEQKFLASWCPLKDAPQQGAGL